jgi:DNA-binding CsgD family transcriptional regulator
LLRVDGPWLPWPGAFAGVQAETVIRLARSDGEIVLANAFQMIDATQQHVARPQILRAQGLLLQRKGKFQEAIATLMQASDLARTQQALIQLARTLDALIEVARHVGNGQLVTKSDGELAGLVEWIGPEARELAWARWVRLQTRSRESRSSSAGISRLTSRERQVAVLVARGLTNRQIAQRLVIAEGTAGVHADHILNKLGFRSRAQVGAWAADSGLLEQQVDGV